MHDAGAAESEQQPNQPEKDHAKPATVEVIASQLFLPLCRRCARQLATRLAYHLEKTKGGAA